MFLEKPLRFSLPLQHYYYCRKMKKSIYFLLFISLMACDTQTPQEKIDNLNGYWAISKAELADGQIKEYHFNAVVDYIEIKDGQGFRKKVKPKLDGTYLVTDKMETINIKIENDSIHLYYTTEMDQWRETMVSSKKNELVFLNKHGNKYTYQRFTGYLDEAP